MAEASGDLTAGPLLLRIAGRVRCGRLRPNDLAILRVTAQAMREQDAHSPPLVFLETALQWLGRPRLV